MFALRFPAALWITCTALSLPMPAQGKLMRYLESLPKQSISTAERDQLLTLRQEEKLARDVYQVLYAVWRLPAFDNIAQSEQSHMNLVKWALDRYAIPDPLTSDAWGVYRDAQFATLFVELVRFGLNSPVHALAVGAFIEDLDIADLDTALRVSDNRDLDTVWQNLQRGSRNHLRSFYKLLLDRGIAYPGFVLSYAQIQAIVTTAQETQPVDENGNPL
ncbi:MAG: DUF2202 domain-containing protein [Planctomycetes bacterium]|nr:DUF2202 domain-containing protein [Planctomycetota bacterium]MCB9889118.1 DUF2202 domain-containing protein [Planctomycetota bacterium]